MLLTLLACGPVAEESPATLEQMTQSAITHFWGDEAEADINGIVAWIEENKDAEIDGYYFSALPEEVVADIEHDPDVVWEECQGAAVLLRVDGTLEAYVSAQVEADQSFADSSYGEWSRCTADGTTAGFLAGERLATDDHVEKASVGITIPYDMHKDFRWFGDTLAAFSWVPQAGYDESGDNGIVGGFTLEIWVEDDGGLLWYNGQWSDLKTLLDALMADNPEAALDLLIAGTRDYMEGTEEHVLEAAGAPLAEACP